MIHFINKAVFDSRSFVSVQYDWGLLLPVVEDVQFMYIKKLLGSNLYTAMQTKVQAYVSSGTEMGAYKTLLDDYIIPAMVWYIKAEMAMSAKFRIKPGGIFEAAPENNAAISTDDLKWFVDECRNKAESYGQEMVNYLIENATASFPEYNTNEGLDKTHPQGFAYQSPFYTKGKRLIKPYPNYND